ncbi:MAG: hypothetical protein GDA43_26075 [Hormoscilla sp. SP5CHS1]|nr:hypothetical protein [Hormoscilla sp. SP5CHS1]
MHSSPATFSLYCIFDNLVIKITITCGEIKGDRETVYHPSRTPKPRSGTPAHRETTRAIGDFSLPP